MNGPSESWAYAKSDVLIFWRWLAATMTSAQAIGWTAALSAFASAIAAIFAAQQVSLSAEQTRLAAEVPFKQVLFQAKLQALEDYTRATSQFDLDFRVALISLKGPTTAENFYEFSDLDMKVIAISAVPMISRFHSYFSAAEGFGSIWQPNAQRDVKLAQQAAVTDVRCFTVLGAASDLNSAQWLAVRRRATEPCDDALRKHASHIAFLEASETAKKAMRLELANDANDKGPPRVSTMERFIFR